MTLADNEVERVLAVVPDVDLSAIGAGSLALDSYLSPEAAGGHPNVAGSGEVLHIQDALATGPACWSATILICSPGSTSLSSPNHQG